MIAPDSQTWYDAACNRSDYPDAVAPSIEILSDKQFSYYNEAFYSRYESISHISKEEQFMFYLFLSAAFDKE